MEFLYLEEVDSTNKWSKEHLSGIGDMTLIYTSKQTAGRGRFNRKWMFTGGENVYATLVLKPSKKMKEVYSNLTQYLCVILCETFEEYGVKSSIKWPNDIQIKGKKISGILAEAVSNQNGLEGIVIGFGVNLNTTKEIIETINQPATSLNIETGMKIDREKFLKRLLDKFCLMYDKFIEEGFLLIREDYKKRAGFLNKQITVRVFAEEISGVAKDVTDQGALKLIDNNNKEHVLFIGDIL